MSETNDRQMIGVVGAGSFGTAIGNLLAYNADVLMYSRTAEVVETINKERRNFGVDLSSRIRATDSLEEIAAACTLIFPVVPSVNFREMMQALGPFLRPYHILIHGTKGFDVYGIDENRIGETGIRREHVHTMSEIILQESSVVRVGCLSGPNLAKEIMEGQPTATVIGSRFDEVISAGKAVLSSRHFHVFGTYEILGAELAGVLKNVIAIGSGILKGRGLGKNIQAMLITRGLTEMVHFGNRMGASSAAFFGTAGIGDLVATATSINSRNFTFGYRLGQGENFDDIVNSMPELAEGVRTLKITRHLAKYYKLRVPITEMLYSVVFEGFEIEKALDYLMTFPYDIDVDFL
jgi:glycerol-3-phosphate dehydrogenase (NAD(P)+)